MTQVERATYLIAARTCVGETWTAMLELPFPPQPGGRPWRRAVKKIVFHWLGETAHLGLLPEEVLADFAHLRGPLPFDVWE